MPFILHETKNGITEPRFQCDQCGELIDDAGGALLLWKEFDKKTQAVNPRVACKECDYTGAEDYPMSMELDTALIFLLNNCGMIPKRIKEQTVIARHLGSI